MKQPREPKRITTPTKPLAPSGQISNVIRLAWEDRTSFEEIKERTGLAESEVIEIMRRELKPASFRRWRKRVAGRITKHRRLLERSFRGVRQLDADDFPKTPKRLGE